MNIARNMEAIFLALVFLTSAMGFASAAVPAKHVRGPEASVALNDAGMAVVTITAKRLSAAEKAKLAN